MSGRLDNAPVGLVARLLFDGVEAARGAVTGVGAAGSVSLSFAVPADTAPGAHTVVFVGTGFQCDATRDKPVEVLSDTERSRGGLSRTGITLAVYLAIGLVLLVGGAALTLAARDRRRRRRSHHGVPLKELYRSH
jgi:hypothetical protein